MLVADHRHLALVPLWWARALRSQPNALIVAIALAGFVGEAPAPVAVTVNRIADATDIRPDRVFSALRSLEEAGIIRRQERKRGKAAAFEVALEAPFRPSGTIGQVSRTDGKLLRAILTAPA